MGIVPVAPSSSRLVLDGESSVKGLSDIPISEGFSTRARMKIAAFA